MTDTRNSISSLVDCVVLTRVDSEELSNSDAIPHVVATGTLRIIGVELQVVQLSDGRRIIPLESIESFLEGNTND
jgi:hypothetical protein